MLKDINVSEPRKVLPMPLNRTVTDVVELYRVDRGWAEDAGQDEAQHRHVMRIAAPYDALLLSQFTSPPANS
jgi:hypothetical protein